MIKSNERILIKRTDVGGAIPTIPSTTDHSDGTWLATDVYVGELMMNTTDNKLWWRSDNNINLIYSSGNTSQFVDLTDTPMTFTSYAGGYLKVNSAETALEYATIPVMDHFTLLVDCPNTYFGYAGYNLTVNSAETALEFTQNISTFKGLTDTPMTYDGYDGYALIVNELTSGITYKDITKYADVSIINTFETSNIFNGIIYANSGITIGLNGFNEISTDFDTHSDTQIPTTLAVYNFVEKIALSGMTPAGVAYVAESNMFTEKNTFDTDIQITKGAVIIGDSATDGSFRLYINNNGALEISKLVDSSWKLCNSFDVQ